MALMLSLPEVLSSQNPVINHCFTADPTARVFNDKIYMYPSHDIVSPVERLKEWFCMEDYHVYSSENLVDRLDGPRRNTLAGACALGRARVLLHVGARLRV